MKARFAVIAFNDWALFADWNDWQPKNMDVVARYAWVEERNLTAVRALARAAAGALGVILNHFTGAEKENHTDIPLL